MLMILLCCAKIWSFLQIQNTSLSRCDDCYEHSSRPCRKCDTPLTFQQRKWGSGVCDTCYDKYEAGCMKCGALAADFQV